MSIGYLRTVDLFFVYEDVEVGIMDDRNAFKHSTFTKKEVRIIRNVESDFEYLFRVYDLVYVAMFSLKHYKTSYGYDLGGYTCKILTQVGALEDVFETIPKNVTYSIADIVCHKEGKENRDALSL